MQLLISFTQVISNNQWRKLDHVESGNKKKSENADITIWSRIIVDFQVLTFFHDFLISSKSDTLGSPMLGFWQVLVYCCVADESSELAWSQSATSTTIV